MATQGIKRSAPEVNDVLEDVKAILVDLEGTTTLSTKNSFYLLFIINYYLLSINYYLLFKSRGPHLLCVQEAEYWYDWLLFVGIATAERGKVSVFF